VGLNRSQTSHLLRIGGSKSRMVSSIMKYDNTNRRPASAWLTGARSVGSILAPKRKMILSLFMSLCMS